MFWSTGDGHAESLNIRDESLNLLPKFLRVRDDNRSWHSEPTPSSYSTTFVELFILSVPYFCAELYLRISHGVF
jgi:hypothetical protein